jgi:hypothetical protein
VSGTLVRQRLPGTTVLPSGLEIDDDLTYEDWVQVGQELARMHSLSAWAIGDWAHKGEELYGRKYEAALEVTGLAYQTVRNYVYVAGRFDLYQRKDNLSFSHHALVAALPPKEREHWLLLAENERLSFHGLREAMSRSAGEVATGSSRLPALSLRPLTAEEVATWNEAAEVLGIPLAELARQALGEKARRVLDEAAGASE